MFSTQEVAAHLAIDPKHVRRLARKLLPGVASTGRWEFNDEHLEVLRNALSPKKPSLEWKEANGAPLLKIESLRVYNSQEGAGIRNYVRTEREERRQKLLRRLASMN